jgi:Acetyltransferase (GNAT) domain
MVFCRVRSWLTGSRLVSLPFSDHCEPLCDSFEELGFLVRYLQSTLEHEDWTYLEVRSTSWNVDEVSDANEPWRPFRYFVHVLDLNRGLDDVFSNLHSDSIQECVHRAERVGLIERVGRSGVLLKEFYDLFLATRRSHQLPPIPYAWFHNLVQCQDGAAEIRLAHQHAQPIAAILTLRFRNVLYYKYACSDTRFHNVGMMPWLLCNAIAAAKATGATAFDMGRTRENRTGLLAFKNWWVSQPQQLVYWSFPRVSIIDSVDGWRLKVAKRILSHIPDKLLALAGKIVYRHIG